MHAFEQVPMHGLGRRRILVHVRVGIFLRGATSKNGTTRHRNVALRGLPLSGKKSNKNCQ